ncbi:MAG: DUF969 domain-containing protein [Eubacteriales bacterium]|nr:DUF969 domain-containing protein [Clostridiales bacterium]MDY5836024.1 DUF969 domain-containing protein [Eubacteriales bacterium]
MEIVKLIGVLIVVIGFAIKLDTISTVVIAGIATGLVAGIPLDELLRLLGEKFLSNRLATMFVLTLPVIGLCERYGLKDKAVDFISQIKAATVGRITLLYQAIRALSAALSLRIGGHPQFVRPLINPMAQAAAVTKYGEVDEKTEDQIKGLVAGAENAGNFFGQNVFMASSGTLLIATTLQDQGYDTVTALEIAKWSIPIAVLSVVVGAIYYTIFDKKLDGRLLNGKKAR